MKYFEYKTEQLTPNEKRDNGELKYINKMGADGWELCYVNVEYNKYYWKRIATDTQDGFTGEDMEYAVAYWRDLCILKQVRIKELEAGYGRRAPDESCTQPVDYIKLFRWVCLWPAWLITKGNPDKSNEENYKDFIIKNPPPVFNKTP